MGSGREPRFVQEYLLSHYSDRRLITNVPLGPVPREMIADVGEEEAIRLYRSWRPRADAVIWGDGEIILLEGEVDYPRNGMSDLLFYFPLWGVTPEYRQWWSLPVRMVLLVPWLPDWLQTVAGHYGVEVVVYTPAWMHDHLAKWQLYNTAEWRHRREDRKAALKALGLE